MNKIKNNDVSHSIDNSSIFSSEPIPSFSEDSSSSTSDTDPYINEKAITNNLLSLTKDYDDKVIDMSALSFDSDYLYLFTSTSDNYLFIMTMDLIVMI